MLLIMFWIDLWMHRASPPVGVETGEADHPPMRAETLPLDAIAPIWTV